MTTAQLLAKARKATAPKRRKISIDKWMPIIDELRRKNWEYAAIWKWLREEGETIHDSMPVFRSAASRAYKRWLNKIAEKNQEAAA